MMMKKILRLDENGETVRIMGEVVVSTCPYRTDKQSGEASIATGPDPLRFEGTNGRKKLCFDNDMNQLAASLGEKFGREEILLDETNTTCRKTD